MNKIRTKTIKRVATVISIVAILAGIFYIAWSKGCFLPGWIIWNNKNIETSVNNVNYSVVLKDKNVIVYSGQENIWSTKDGIKVQDILNSDIDGDNVDELIILCWKRGRFGNAKPFWVDEDEKGWSQHLFVYEYDDGNISPKWMSSYLGFDITKMDTEPVNSEKYGLVFTDRDNLINLFVWDSWGFSKKESEVSFAVFGDNLIHEPIYRYGLKYDTSFSFLFKNVKDIINESDIAIINQETPLVDDSSKYSSYPLFGTPINVGQAIVNAGFDVVTCATNHALDKGMYGIDTTKNFFTENNIACLGIQTSEDLEYIPYEIITKNNIKIALLNYTYGTNGIELPDDNKYAVHLLDDENQVTADIKAARENADIVMVFPHWGTENSTDIDEFQEKWTKLFLDNNVDIVIGTHPHALQPYELLTNDTGHSMLIYYSIGNYISAQSEQSCQKGGIATFTISRTTSGYEVTSYDLIPLTIVAKGDGKYVVERGE